MKKRNAGRASVLDAGESYIYPGKPRVRAVIIKGDAGRVYECTAEEGTGRILEGRVIVDAAGNGVGFLGKLREHGAAEQGSISHRERLANQAAADMYLRILAHVAFMEIATATEAFELFAMEEDGAIMAHWLAGEDGAMQLQSVVGLSEDSALNLPIQGDAEQVMSSWRGGEPEYERGAR